MESTNLAFKTPPHMVQSPESLNLDRNSQTPCLVGESWVAVARMNARRRIMEYPTSHCVPRISKVTLPASLDDEGFYDNTKLMPRFPRLFEVRDAKDRAQHDPCPQQGNSLIRKHGQAQRRGQLYQPSPNATNTVKPLCVPGMKHKPSRMGPNSFEIPMRLRLSLLKIDESREFDQQHERADDSIDAGSGGATDTLAGEQVPKTSGTRNHQPRLRPRFGGGEQRSLLSLSPLLPIRQVLDLALMAEAPTDSLLQSPSLPVRRGSNDHILFNDNDDSDQDF
jgi:hypothetical protein